jgi:hexokinase
MLYTLDQLNQFRQNLWQEVQAAAEGQTNSLAFAKNPLPAHNLVADREVFQVMMIGGSHLETAQARFREKQLELEGFWEEDIPKLHSREIVCQLVEKFLSPEVQVVCLNFAYPLEAFNRRGGLDGTLLRAPKEHKFEGLVGEAVGQTIEKYIREKTGRQVRVLVGNDTTALGLSGLTLKYPEYQPREMLAGVVGTGFNFGLFQDDHTFINLESGNFDKFTQSVSGSAIDQQSNNPGQQRLEKEVGGAYLVSHFNYLAQQYGLEGELQDSKELSEVAQQDSGQLSELARKLLSRSASLVAMEIAALKDFAQAEKILVILEGSLAWKGYGYLESLRYYLEKLEIPAEQYELFQEEQMGLKGIAKLARVEG